MPYRHGFKDGFFDGVTTFNQTTAPYGGVGVSTGDYSVPVQIGRAVTNLTIFVASSGTSAFKLQVAPIGDQTAEGIFPDDVYQTYVWYDLYYLGNAGSGASTPITLSTTGAQNVAGVIPNFEPNWLRLWCTSGSSITVTAGWEVQG